VSPRRSAFIVAAALGSLHLACPRKMPAQRGRGVPVCATQDCATGRILDDGCTDDGRCASCVNACPNLPIVDEDAASVVRDASSCQPRGGVDARLDAAPASPLQMRALAGEGTAGVFWIPVKGDFPFEDLLLTRDGQYVTHLHDRPGAFGAWHMDGGTLTLEGWMGVGPYVLRGVHFDAHELRGVADGTTIVLRRMR
jgi:hypothetical protein